MKKLIAGVLFIFPLVVHATPAPNIVRGVGKLAADGAAKTSAWRGLPQAMKKNVGRFTRIRCERFGCFSNVDRLGF